jgi:hypothetical protein
MVDRHSGVSTGAVKKSSSLTDIVCVSGFARAGGVVCGIELLRPVKVPSSSFNSVCRSIEVKALKELG